MPGIVFVNKHTQPSNDLCLTKLIQQNYGKIDALALIQIAAIHATGDTHAAVYDYTGNYIYISNASPVSKGAIPAFKRQFTRISLTDLWNEKNVG